MNMIDSTPQTNGLDERQRFVQHQFDEGADELLSIGQKNLLSAYYGEIRQIYKLIPKHQRRDRIAFLLRDQQTRVTELSSSFVGIADDIPAISNGAFEPITPEHSGEYLEAGTS